MLTKPSIEIIEQNLFAGAVADEIAAALSECIHDRGSVSLVLAGGSSPAAIYRALSRPPRVDEVDWQKVKIFFGDERWVGHEDAQSNCRMVSETLLSSLPSPGPSFYPIQTNLGSVQSGANAYSDTIRTALKLGPKELPKFDIVLLGIGENGHTASLFPGDKAISEREALAVAVVLEDSQRISLSPHALFSAERVFFIVSGQSKAEVIKQILEGSDSPEKFPARLFTEAKGKVTFFLDSAAGSLLSI